MKYLTQQPCQTDHININLDSQEFQLNSQHFIIERTNLTLDNYSDILNKDHTLLVYINLTQNEEILFHYYSNILATSVQKFRKELKLKSWEKISVNYNTESHVLINSFTKNKNQIEKVVRNPIYLNRDFKHLYKDKKIYEKFIDNGEEENYILQINMV